MNERFVSIAYKNSQVIRKLVMLVLISINHLIPVEKEEVAAEGSDDRILNGNTTALNREDDDSENHEGTQEEIIDLQTMSHLPDFTPSAHQEEVEFERLEADRPSQTEALPKP